MLLQPNSSLYYIAYHISHLAGLFGAAFTLTLKDEFWFWAKCMQLFVYVINKTSVSVVVNSGLHQDQYACFIS